MQVITKERKIIMALFGKKQPELPENFLDDEPEMASGIDHNSVLDYLLQLTTADYDKLLKLTNIYRDANKQAGELIPQYDPDRAETVEVQEFGKSETIVVRTGTSSEDEDEIDKMLDDELAAAFIEDEPKTSKKAKSNGIASKN